MFLVLLYGVTGYDRVAHLVILSHGNESYCVVRPVHHQARMA